MADTKLAPCPVCGCPPTMDSSEHALANAAAVFLRVNSRAACLPKDAELRHERAAALQLMSNALAAYLRTR